MFSHAHVEPQHGIFRPFLLHAVDVESLEQFLPSLEICLECRYKQRLSEPSGATQEDITPEVYHVPDVPRFVNIEIVTIDDFLKGLYAYGQPLHLSLFHTHLTIVCKDNENRMKYKIFVGILFCFMNHPNFLLHSRQRIFERF